MGKREERKEFISMEECVTNDPVLSPEEMEVLDHFHNTNSCSDDGRSLA